MQKHRVDVAEEMLEQVNNDPTFIKRVITSDGACKQSNRQVNGVLQMNQGQKEFIKPNQDKNFVHCFHELSRLLCLMNFSQKVEQLIKSTS